MNCSDYIAGTFCPENLKNSILDYCSRRLVIIREISTISRRLQVRINDEFYHMPKMRQRM